MRSFYGLPSVWNLFNNVPRRILAEGINGPAQVAGQMPRGTQDTGGCIHGPMGHSGYTATPQMRAERVGEAPKVTAGAPRGTRTRTTSTFGKNLSPLTVPKVQMLQTAFAVNKIMQKVLALPLPQRTPHLIACLDRVRPTLATTVGLRSAQLMRQGKSPEQALRVALTATLTVADAQQIATFNEASGAAAQAGALGAIGTTRTVTGARANQQATGIQRFDAPPAPSGPPWQMVPTISVEGLPFPIDAKLKNHYGDGMWFVPSPTPYAPEQMLALAVAAANATKALRDQGDKYLGPTVTVGEWPLLAKIFPPSAHHLSFALRMLEPWKYRPLAKFRAPQLDATTDLGLYLWVTFKGNKNRDYWWSDTNQLNQHNGQFTKMRGNTPSDWKIEDVEQVFATIQPFRTTVRTTWYNDAKAFVVDNAGTLACAAAGITAASVGGTAGGVIAGAAGTLCAPGAGAGAAPIPDRPLPAPPGKISITTWLVLGAAAAGLGYTLLKR